MVADKVKQVLSLGIPLKEKRIRGNVYLCYWRTREVWRKEKKNPLQLNICIFTDLVNEPPADQRCIRKRSDAKSTLCPGGAANDITHYEMNSVDCVTSKWIFSPLIRKSIFFRVQTATRKRVLIFHSPRGSYMRVIKYSYRGSSHLWKLWEISAAEKTTWKRAETRCGERKRQAEATKGRALDMQCSTKSHPLMCHKRTWRYTF